MRVAEEVRALMARQRRKNIDLAAELLITPQSLSKRLSGEQPFSIDELVVVARFLDVSLQTFTSAAAS